MSKAKVLVLIDDTELRDYTLEAFEKLEYRLVEPRGNFLERVFDEVPHLIIIDEHYRDGEGRRIALGLKEDPVLKHIPVILVMDEKTSVVPRRLEKIDSWLPRTKNPRALVAKAREILSRDTHELDVSSLTHMPGIRSTISRIERAIRTDKDFAVCCIDLSDLGAYNTAYGDVRGDEVIIQFSKMIQQAVKRYGSAEAFLGHLGGDDFIVVTSSETCVAVCEALIKQFDQVGASYYDAHDREQGYLVQRNKEGALTQYPLMRVCITIIQNEVTPIDELPEISRIAQELKNYMKTLPGSCYIKYCRLGEGAIPLAEPGAAGAAEPMLEICFPSRGKSVLVPRLYRHGGSGIFLDSLLKEKEIRTVYQPIVDLQTRVPVGYEALTRTLTDPCNEEVSKLFFAAREAGCIKELDALCVESALKSGQKLPSGKKLFINVNHETLIDQRLMKELFAHKGSIGFKSIVIEVTEQSLLRSFDKIRDMLIELKEQGVLVAIDDVGGGAVSLRDVATLRPDYIKFDRSLIRQIDQSTTKQQVVLSMILFAKGIRAMTSAEGIVSKEEYETCLMCGIDLGQGHYFGKPETGFASKSQRC